ncbi:MAG: hypothetical protein HC842_03415 [Cytophagales bacterium]|nr:hypothetical protein [Cytophagales bacterium]
MEAMKVNIYKYAYYLVIRFMKRANKKITDEKLEDGSFWIFNLIGAYCLNAVIQVFFSSYTKEVDKQTSVTNLLIFWLVLIILNYILFMSRKRWKLIVSDFDGLSASERKKWDGVTLGVFGGGWLLLTLYWLVYIVPR